MEYFFLAPHSKAIVVAKNWEVQTDLIEFLEEFQVPAVVRLDISNVLERDITDLDPTFLIVSIDDFGGPTEVLNSLFKLRERLSNTSVILVSSDFLTDNFDTHRLQVADVSLRYPLTKSSLFTALKQGPINLKTWKKRAQGVDLLIVTET